KGADCTGSVSVGAPADTAPLVRYPVLPRGGINQSGPDGCTVAASGARLAEVSQSGTCHRNRPGLPAAGGSHPAARSDPRASATAPRSSPARPSLAPSTAGLQVAREG